MKSMERAAFFGDGMGRVRLEYMADGSVQLRERVRAGDDARGPYHRVVITPDCDIAADDFLTRRGVSDTFKQGIRSEVEQHRTTERKSRWDQAKQRERLRDIASSKAEAKKK